MITAAAYCRVSTDQGDQVGSFEAQKQYFEDYIKGQTQLQLYRIYADEGISGTSTKNRTCFHEMMRDAREGRFKLLLTKEVSRFSRNILDTIAYTRELRQLGVAVRFVTDGIDTTDPDAELRLSIMASIAQEESRRTSARVVWGQTRQMEKGVVFGRSLLGYTVRNGQIELEPQGAETVRKIFMRYAVDQISCTRIAAELEEQGIKTATGGESWSASSILRILKNEKYVGDLIQKKTYTPDYLTHEKQINRGQVSKIEICDHHEPIISRDLWSRAQDRLAAVCSHNRTAHAGSVCALSGKVRCGVCGRLLSARTKYRKDGTWYRRWCCPGDGANSCKLGRILRDDDALQMVKTALCSISIDREGIANQIVCQLVYASEKERERLQKELLALENRQRKTLEAYCDGRLTETEYRTAMQYCTRQINEKQQSLVARSNHMPDRAQCIETVMELLNGKTESEQLYRSVVDEIIVYPDRYTEVRLVNLPYIFSFS